MVLTSFLSLAPFHADAKAEDSKEMTIGITDVYMPRTRARSDAYVVVSGLFQNGCYRWSHAAVTNIDDKLHEVRSYADVQQGMCIMVLIPFTKEVQLGQLNPGTHKLRFMSGDGTYLEREMKVE